MERQTERQAVTETDEDRWGKERRRETNKQTDRQTD